MGEQALRSSVQIKKKYFLMLQLNFITISSKSSDNHHDPVYKVLSQAD